MRKAVTPVMQQPIGPGAPIPGGLQNTSLQEEGAPLTAASQNDILSMLGGRQ